MALEFSSQHVGPQHNLVKKKVSAAATTKRGPTSNCAVCPDLAPCPKCPTGQMCQLSVPPSCQQCAKNTCVDDPNYQRPSKAGPVGGAIGGMLAAAALAAILFFLWRKKHLRAKAAAKRARANEKLRNASAEKFRLGSKDSKDVNDTGHSAGLRRLSPTDDGQTAQGNVTGNTEDDSEDDDDVEWTELREDGLTTFKQRSGDIAHGEQDVMALRRRSIGAATHLSRITEGAEEDEGEQARRRSVLQDLKNVAPSSESDYRIATGHTSSTSIGGDVHRARSRKSQTLRIPNPFADSYDISTSSLVSDDEIQDRVSISSSTADRPSPVSETFEMESSRWSGTPLEAPSRVHRPAGSPVIDLHGNLKSKRPGGTSRANSGFPSPTSPSHLSFTMQDSAPSRPQRNADLNLRLDDGVEPGRIGDDLKKRKLIASMGIKSPPASASSQDVSDITRNAVSSVNMQMSKRNTNRASAMTASSIGTMDYIMSSPQIITPLATDGPKRLQLKQGKAQLVRSLSAIKREQEERKALDNQSQNSHNSLKYRSLSPVDARGERTPEPEESIDTSLGNGQIRKGPFAFALQANSVPSGFHSEGRSSAMSGASLPFVERPMEEPAERSPSDIHARDSIATTSAVSPRQSHLYTQRQSAASIGGLSLFDEIPFHIGQDDTDHVEISMPEDAQTRIQKVKQNIDRRSDTILEANKTQDEGPFSDEARISVLDEALVPDPVPSPSRASSSISHPGSHSSLHSHFRNGTNPNFDQIRLRHELDNYPFDLKQT